MPDDDDDKRPSTVEKLGSGFRALGRAVVKFWRAIAKTSFFYAFIVTPLSIYWWWYASSTSAMGMGLLIAVSLACFMLGALIGFVLTSYGEESGTIGKVRDWLIGGITGATLVQAAQGGGVFKNFLWKFVTGDDPHGNQFGMVMSMAIVYSALGFLFMFLQRELVWNPHLAAARKERGLLDGSRQATSTVQKLQVQLPPDVLTGVQDISEVDVSSKVKEDLRSVIYAADVDTFLKQADEALKSGQPLGWEDVYKVANIHYYRAYYESGDRHPPQVRKALEWINRALVINPLHADLTMKCADMLGDDHQEDAAVALLENLVVRAETPAVAFQWLGFYLRSNSEQLDNSIFYSRKFLELFPGDRATRFNLAYAYAEKYCEELRESGAEIIPNSVNRVEALGILGAIVREQPDYKKDVEKSIHQHKGFACFRGDEIFEEIMRRPGNPGA